MKRRIIEDDSHPAKVALENENSRLFGGLRYLQKNYSILSHFEKRTGCVKRNPLSGETSFETRVVHFKILIQEIELPGKGIITIKRVFKMPLLY